MNKVGFKPIQKLKQFYKSFDAEPLFFVNDRNTDTKVENIFIMELGIEDHHLQRKVAALAQSFHKFNKLPFLAASEKVING